MARTKNETCIGDLRTRTIPAVPEHVTIAAARKVAALKRVADLFVERDGRLVGVLDERTLAAAAEEAEVSTVMAPIDVCLHPAMPAARARELFMQSGATVLPVTFGALLLGAVARGDVEQALARRCAAPGPRRVRLRAAAA
jgi:CBS domain-containing protein